MAQKRSARPIRKKVKTASAPPLESDFFEIATADDPTASDRAAKLGELQKDKEFLPETIRIRDRLLELRSRDRQVFNRFFSTADYSASFNPSKIDRLISNTEYWDTFRDLFDYARRFNVWIQPKPVGTGLRASVEPPFSNKFQGLLVEGRVVDVGLEPLWETPDNLEDTEIETPNDDLKQLMDSGRAQYVELHDRTGTSALNDLERMAYHPSKLTFIIHNRTTRMPCIFLLVGERTEAGDLRKAEKILTALQEKFYGRVKSGRPIKNQARDFAVFQELRKNNGRNQKEIAAEVFRISGAAGKSRRSGEVKLSRIKKRYNLKDS